MRLALVFILFSVIGYGQSRVSISGTLEAAGGVAEGVVILNSATNKATVSNASGDFKIDVVVGDILFFKAIQYKNIEQEITKALLEKGSFNLFLTPRIEELEEVKISNISLSGNLSRDVRGIKIDPSKIAYSSDASKPIPVEERRLHTATSRSADQVGQNNLRFDVSLDGIINGLSGKTKRLKKHIKVSRFQAMVTRVRNYYGDGVFINDLKIPSDHINNFVFYALENREASEEFEINNRMEVLQYLIDTSAAYIEMIDTERDSKINKQ